jgi:hypothetical protein
LKDLERRKAVPKAIHCLCHNNDGQAPAAFRHVDGDIYKTGFWVVRDNTLIDALREHGWLYLHDRSNLSSWFIGVIIAAEQMHGTGQRNIEGKWDFTVQRRDINPKPWRGDPATLNPAGHVRIVDCIWKFELAPISKPTLA